MRKIPCSEHLQSWCRLSAWVIETDCRKEPVQGEPHPSTLHVSTPHLQEAQEPRNTAEGMQTGTCQLHPMMNLVGTSDLPKPLAVVQSGLKCDGGEGGKVGIPLVCKKNTSLDFPEQFSCSQQPFITANAT